MSESQLQPLVHRIFELKKSIDTHKPLDDTLSKTLQNKLRIEWIYNSNAIEGNTLTIGETHFFLQEGLTSEGKPLKDFLEAKNHSEALDVLYDFVADKQPMSEFFIKSLHGVLLKGIDFTIAKGQQGFVRKPLHAGTYKTQPNHVLTISGEVHHYTHSLHTASEMKKLVSWAKIEDISISPIEKAALFHYEFVKIHPFDDGNGRMARLLMNILLMQADFPPCIIKNKNRRHYLASLEEADTTNNPQSFLVFIAQEMIDSMTFILDVVSSKKKMLSDPFKKHNKSQRQTLLQKTIKNEPISIGQIHEKLPHIKRPTLKKDLQELTARGKILSRGKGKGTVYYVN